MFLAYLLINLVNCQFFLSHPITVCKNKFNTHFFLFLCSRFHNAEITSRRILYYVRTYLLLRRDVANATSGRIFYCMATGGNKVTTEIPLIATRYLLIIKELSISVANVALSQRKYTHVIQLNTDIVQSANSSGSVS